MSKTEKIFKYFLCMGLGALFVLTATSPNKAYAQKCGDVFTDDDIIKYFDRNICLSVSEIYRMPAIVGERAIPGLRKLIESGRCGRYEMMNAYTALARLGVQEAFNELEKMVHEPMRNNSAFYGLAFVRNNQAISILMTYFSKYRSDPSMKNLDNNHSFYDHLFTITRGIRSITFAWNVPAVDMPVYQGNMMANPTRDEWEAWWNKQKDIPFSPPDFSDISDPQLRCLARMAEWGLPEAVIAMTEELPGKEKEVASILKTFQRVLTRFGNMSGTIDVALLRLGDRSILTELTNDLGEKPVHVRDQALEKLQIANTKESIEALLNALEIEIDVREFELNRFRGEILNALSQMVVDPPLETGSLPTLENFQKWKQWWSDNKDTAILKREPINRNRRHYFGIANNN